MLSQEGRLPSQSSDFKRDCSFSSETSASSKPTTEFAQPGLSKSNGGHPQREGTNLGVFVPILKPVLPSGDATNLGVFDLCHVALLKRGLEKD